MIEYKDNKLIAEFMSMEDHQEMGEYVTLSYGVVVSFIEAHNKDKEKVSVLKYLHDKGYAVEHLWHVHDVQQGYDCSDEIALKLLNDTLGSDNVCEGVFDAMDVIASNEFKLKPKE